MKKPVLLFALKCTVIIYFAACSGIDSFTASKSVTPQVTKGNWKVNCYSNTATDNTCIFDGYTFTFEATGKVTAQKNGTLIEGNWLEDDINKSITISFKNSGTALDELSDYWSVAAIQDGHISFEKKEGSQTDKLYITAL
jgi:hypothetical protein